MRHTLSHHRSWMIWWPCLPLLEEGILRCTEVMLSFILIISDQVNLIPCYEKFNILKTLVDINFAVTKNVFVNYRKRTQPWLMWCLWRRRRSHLLRQLPGFIPFRVSCSAAWRRGYSTCKYYLNSIISHDCCKDLFLCSKIYREVNIVWMSLGWLDMFALLPSGATSISDR